MTNEIFTISRSTLTCPQGSTIFITGGSSGIGLETALLLHQIGNNNVVVVDRTDLHRSAPQSLISSPRFHYQKCDVTSWESQRAAFEATINKFGSIEAVFINAGIGEYGNQFFQDNLDQDGLLQEPDHKTVNIDLIGANYTMKLAIYYMKNRPSGKAKGGSIVLTTSLAGYLASTGAPLYSAAKHGIISRPNYGTFVSRN